MRSITHELLTRYGDYGKMVPCPTATSGKRNAPWVCGNGLRRYFDVPLYTKKIWVTLSYSRKRPTLDAVELRDTSPGGTHIEIPPGVPRKKWSLFHNNGGSTARLAHRFEYISLYSSFAHAVREIDEHKCWMRVHYT